MESVVLLILRTFGWGYGLLPRGIQRALGKLLGVFLWVLRPRVQVIRQNLKIAFPDKKSTLFFAYEHLGHLTLEVLLVLGPLKRFVKKYAVLLGKENWSEAKKKGKGVIFLSSHVGNWEIMAACGALNGIELLLVTKHLKPEWLHLAIEEGRKKCDVLGTYEPKTMKDVLKHLKKHSTVGMILDQYAGPPVGVRVPFFGVPVGTHTAIAMLAKRTGAAVVPVVNYRGKDGKHYVQIYPALDWVPDPNPQKEIAVNTALYASILERHVRQFPEQWLWTHRRFKGDLSPLKESEWERGRLRE